MNIAASDTPYLLTLNRYSAVPSTSALTNLKVSGVLIEVSDYFDIITHQKSKYSDNIVPTFNRCF